VLQRGRNTEKLCVDSTLEISYKEPGAHIDMMAQLSGLLAAAYQLVPLGRRARESLALLGTDGTRMIKKISPVRSCWPCGVITSANLQLPPEGLRRFHFP
jgi:hypothetical protein